MNWFQRILLTILQKLFHSERPSESELISIGFQQGLQEAARRQEQQQSAIYEQPGPHTEPIPQVLVRSYRPGQRLRSYRLSHLETEHQLPSIWLKDEKR